MKVTGKMELNMELDSYSSQQVTDTQGFSPTITFMEKVELIQFNNDNNKSNYLHLCD